MNFRWLKDRRVVARILAACPLLVLLIVPCVETLVQKHYNNNLLSFISKNPNHSLATLNQIQLALHQYHSDHGHYPASLGFDGFITCWGRSSPTWISSLIPKYLDRLPRDPRHLEACDKQFLYYSNSKDFKLISHSPDDCLEMKKTLPFIIDPKRNCYAYGFWSDGAEFL